MTSVGPRSPLLLAPRAGVVHRIPPATGVAFRVARGQTLRVTDPLGHQVADLFSLVAGEGGEALSSGRSIDYADKLWLSSGDVLHGSRSTPLWRIGRDDVGRHDLTLTPCSREMFVKLRGDDGSHPSCQDNLERALATLGVAAHRITCSFNIFMDVRFDPATGKMTIAPPASRAGDCIELVAEADQLVGLTACSSEVTNDGQLKPIDFVLLG